MGVVDIVFGIFLLVLGLRGVLRGLIKEVFGLAGLFGGIFAAMLFAKNFGRVISSHITISPAIAYAFAFFAIFIVVYIVLLVAGFVISSIAHKIQLGWIDRGFGFLFGLLKGAVLIAVVAFLLESFPFLKGFDVELKHRSVIYSAIEKGVNRLEVARYLHQLKQKSNSKITGGI
ncbi:CvpA family protein [Hippea jasoniae]|uniref:CvpA family protein n=1 Tax=Hippea jasoniae TaxID=944479 RepID=UPI00055514AE|nr:CvpA family protein [Hippea jasoniae]